MVRRWSRINTSNGADYFDYTIAYKVHHLKVFRTTTYFKRFYFGWTKQKRRKAALKKRTSYLAPHMNIMGMWANDYRFFKHVTRFNYTSNLFLVNYIVNNNVSYANIQMLQNLKFDSFITASCANRVVRYYTRQQLIDSFINKYTKDALLHSLSTYNPQTLLNLDEQEKALTPVGYLYQNHIYPLDTPITHTDTFPLLMQNLENQNMVQVTLIYRILILTYLSTLQF